MKRTFLQESIKHKLMLMVCLISGIAVSAQQRPVPAAYPSNVNVNFVRTWDAMAPETNAATFITRQNRDVRMTTQYSDGLGRPVQTVICKGSLISGANTAYDVVVPIEYDELQREKFKYLPYVDPGTDGTFKTNPFAAQATFMTSLYSTQGETWFYGQQNFEASPLSRVQESFAPGNAWVGTSGQSLEANRRSIKTKYYLNTTIDAVKIWNVFDVTNNFGTYSLPVTPAAQEYAAGTLIKTISVDEHGKQVIEFKDKEGKVILKKVQLTAAADDGIVGSAYTGWLCTYYIYDKPGNLRCVIQPQGVELISAAGWALTDATILAQQCFRYEYDYRGRMIMKKVPGADETWMVYDALDRLVLTQDAKMRSSVQKKWLYTTYDFLNRPVETGQITDAANYNNLSYHLAAAALSTAYPNLASYAGYETLTNTFYDNYGWQSIYSTGLSAVYNNSFDGYFEAVSNSTWPYGQSNVATADMKNVVTGTRTKVLGTSTWLYTVVIYNDKGRMIQTQATNNSGGVDINTIQYTWVGQPLVSVQKIAGPSSGNTIAVSRMTYDELGRLVKTEKRAAHNTPATMESDPPAYSVISEMKYDAMGQLKEKQLGRQKDINGNYTSNPLEKLVYDYNIRGWVTSLNKGYFTGTTPNHYFGMELAYDKLTAAASGTSYAAAQYNGNIAGTLWRSKGDGVNRQYDFAYDNVNRLMKADFKQKNDDNSWNNSIVNYNVKMGNGTDVTSAYDANGNILQMQQWGLLLTTSGQIDNLKYTYITNTNKLKSVTDFNNSLTTILGDFKTNATHPQNVAKSALTSLSTAIDFDAIIDYSYDVNGNMELDNNKAISSITYNYLNLPSVITVTGKGTIAYTYDATGNKLKKVTTDNTVVGKTITTTTNYIGGLVYESKATVPANSPNDDYTDVLQFMGHEEGRTRFKIVPGSVITSMYDYFVKDHLGNVRMVLTEETTPNIYPAATMEGTYDGSTNSMVNYEKQFYKIDNTKIVAETSIPSWGTESVANTKQYYNYNTSPPGNPNYPSGCTPVQTDGSTKLYKLNATGNKTGLEFVMKVMAGDKVDIMGKSYYLNTTNITNANSTTLDLLGLMTTFLTAPANAAAGKGFSASLLNMANTGLVPSTFFRGANSEAATTVPKAYINYILLDEQFKYTGGGFSRVGVSGTVKDHWQVDATLQNITVPKNGYLFVYVSNESNFDVFFDNVQVIHKPGAILEETHYYPFGLTMAGISSKAAGGIENKFKYNSKEEQRKEFSDGSGLELYDFHARMQDQQLGRFWQLDPKGDLFPLYNLYNYCFNNPMIFVDPDGMLAKYNWDNGKYYDEGKEVSWNEVQKQYNVGDYAKSTSIILTGEYEKDGSGRLTNDGNGALTMILNIYKNNYSNYTSGSITFNIINAYDVTDAADQIENLSIKIDNIFLLSHGTYGPASFWIGQTYFDHWDKITQSKDLARIANKLERSSAPLTKNPTIIVYSCLVAGKKNGGEILMSTLAKKMNATVFASEDLNYAYRIGVVDSRSNWKMFAPGAVTTITKLQNVYFDEQARIHYSK